MNQRRGISEVFGEPHGLRCLRPPRDATGSRQRAIGFMPSDNGAVTDAGVTGHEHPRTTPISSTARPCVRPTACGGSQRRPHSFRTAANSPCRSTLLVTSGTIRCGSTHWIYGLTPHNQERVSSGHVSTCANAPVGSNLQINGSPVNAVNLNNRPRTVPIRRWCRKAPVRY